MACPREPLCVMFSLHPRQQDGSAGGPSEVKVWSPDKLDSRGRPLCLRSLAPDPRPAQGSQRQSQASKHGSGRGQVPRVTALAVHPNLSLMAVGCSDGSIILYRGGALTLPQKCTDNNSMIMFDSFIY